MGRHRRSASTSRTLLWASTAVFAVVLGLGLPGCNAVEDIETAMQGGLGFDPTRSWIEGFNSMGSQVILETAERWGTLSAAVQLPAEIAESLKRGTPQEVLDRAFDERRSSASSR